jgi:hypothetical protein
MLLAFLQVNFVVRSATSCVQAYSDLSCVRAMATDNSNFQQKMLSIEEEYRQISVYLNALLPRVPFKPPMVELYYKRLPLLLRKEVPPIINTLFDKDPDVGSFFHDAGNTPPTVSIALWHDFLTLKEARGSGERSIVFMCGATILRITAGIVSKDCNKKFLFGLCAGPYRRVGEVFRAKLLEDLKCLLNDDASGNEQFKVDVSYVDYTPAIFF